MSVKINYTNEPIGNPKRRGELPEVLLSVRDQKKTQHTPAAQIAGAAGFMSANQTARRCAHRDVA